jgi:DNA-binding CsgD family transcriptional regulator
MAALMTASEFRFDRSIGGGTRSVAIKARLSPAALEANLLLHDLLLEVLDASVNPTMVIDSSRRLLCANKAAMVLIERNDAWFLAQGQLHSRGCGNDTLARLVSEVLTTRSSALGMFARCGNSDAYQILARPLPRMLSIDRQPFVLLHVYDPSRTVEASEEQLRAIFPFTRVESQLASRLLSGATLLDAAKGLGVTMNTARTHLKSLFAKTRTRRQTELVRLLTTSALVLQL